MSTRGSTAGCAGSSRAGSNASRAGSNESVSSGPVRPMSPSDFAPRLRKVGQAQHAALQIGAPAARTLLNIDTLIHLLYVGTMRKRFAFRIVGGIAARRADPGASRLACTLDRLAARRAAQRCAAVPRACASIHFFAAGVGARLAAAASTHSGESRGCVHAPMRRSRLAAVVGATPPGCRRGRARAAAAVGGRAAGSFAQRVIAATVCGRCVTTVKF